MHLRSSILKKGIPEARLLEVNAPQGMAPQGMAPQAGANEG